MRKWDRGDKSSQNTTLWELREPEFPCSIRGVPVQRGTRIFDPDDKTPWLRGVETHHCVCGNKNKKTKKRTRKEKKRSVKRRRKELNKAKARKKERMEGKEGTTYKSEIGVTEEGKAVTKAIIDGLLKNVYKEEL